LFISGCNRALENNTKQAATEAVMETQAAQESEAIEPEASPSPEEESVTSTTPSDIVIETDTPKTNLTLEDVKALYKDYESLGISIDKIIPYEGDYLVMYAGGSWWFDWVYGKTGKRCRLMFCEEGIRKLEIIRRGCIRVLTDGKYCEFPSPHFPHYEIAYASVMFDENGEPITYDQFYAPNSYKYTYWAPVSESNTIGSPGRRTVVTNALVDSTGLEVVFGPPADYDSMLYYAVYIPSPKIDIHYNEADKLITLTCQNTALFSGEIESVSDPEKEKRYLDWLSRVGLLAPSSFPAGELNGSNSMVSKAVIEEADGNTVIKIYLTDLAKYYTVELGNADQTHNRPYIRVIFKDKQVEPSIYYSDSKKTTEDTTQTKTNLTENDVRALYQDISEHGAYIENITAYQGDYLVQYGIGGPWYFDWVFGESGERYKLAFCYEGIREVKIIHRGSIQILTDGKYCVTPWRDFPHIQKTYVTYMLDEEGQPLPYGSSKLSEYESAYWAPIYETNSIGIARRAVVTNALVDATGIQVVFGPPADKEGLVGFIAGTASPPDCQITYDEEDNAIIITCHDTALYSGEVETLSDPKEDEAYKRNISDMGVTFPTSFPAGELYGSNPKVSKAEISEEGSDTIIKVYLTELAEYYTAELGYVGPGDRGPYLRIIFKETEPEY
jgi:hypothetical protein